MSDQAPALLDLLASLLPDATEDVTYLMDMEGEGLCLHHLHAEEEVEQGVEEGRGEDATQA